jgi:WD40 repeat protein
MAEGEVQEVPGGEGPGAAEPANDVAFSGQRHLLAAATSRGMVVLWDTATQQRPRMLGSLRLGTGSVASVAFSPDGTLLAAQSAARQIGLWSLADPAQPAAVGTLSAGSQVGPALAFSPDGQILAIGTDAGVVRLWSVGNAAHVIALKPLPAPPSVSVSALAFSPRGRLLAVAYTSGIRLFRLADPARPTLLHSFSIGAKEVPTAVDLGAGGALLTVGSFSGQIRSWLLRDPAQPQALPSATVGHGSVNGLGFSPNGRTLAVSSSDGTLSLWDASFTTGPSLLTSAEAAGAEGLTAIAYSPDGRTIATSDADGPARIWTPPQTLLRPSPLQVHDISVSPDRRMVAVAGDYVWLISDADRARPVVVGTLLSVPGQQIRWAALSPAGHLLAAGTEQGSIRLWNVADPARPVTLGTLVTGLSAVDSLTFTADAPHHGRRRSHQRRRIQLALVGPGLGCQRSGPPAVAGRDRREHALDRRLACAIQPARPHPGLRDERRPQPAAMEPCQPAATRAYQRHAERLARGDQRGLQPGREPAGGRQNRRHRARLADLRASQTGSSRHAASWHRTGRLDCPYRRRTVAAAGDNGGTLWLWDLPAGTSASVQGQHLLSMPAGGAIFGLAGCGTAGGSSPALSDSRPSAGRPDRSSWLSARLW